MKEIWRDIAGYEGYYQVSNTGNVRSVDRIVEDGRSFKGRILKPSYDRRKYKIVILSRGGKLKCFKFHRLVALSFLENPDNLPQINHKDENKENNNVENLEWCTNEYNAKYKSHNYRKRKWLKEFSTEELIEEIKRRKIHPEKQGVFL